MFSYNFTDMAVVDLQRWDRNIRGGNSSRASRSLNVELEEDNGQMNFDITKTADLIGNGLRLDMMKFRDT